MDKYGFHIAFQVESLSGGDWVRKVVHDPEHVEFVVYISELNENGKSNLTSIGVHKCTETDYAKFYSPKKG